MPTAPFPNWLAGNAITASILDSPVQSILKPTDEAVTSSTTLQNDNDLVSATLVVNAQYWFFCYLDYDGGTQGSSDIKIQWAIPSGATLRYQAIGIGTGGGMGFGNTYTAASIPSFGTQGSGATNPCGLTLFGTLWMAGTANTIQLKWAQSTSSATPTTVRAQSGLMLIRTS